MRDRIPGNPGRVLITPESGEAYYATLERADNPRQIGDALNKKNLLPDEVAEKLGLDPAENPVPADAFEHIGEKGLILNFTVHGGTVAPGSANEGDLWVNTSNPITSWTYSSDEPTNPAEGKVWFAANNSLALDTGATGNVIIYPLSAAQFTLGVWMGVDVKIYRDGKWGPEKPPYIYLYNNGAEDISGGFKGEPYKPSGAGGTVLTPVVDYFDSSKHPIKITLPSGGYAFSIFNETAFSIDGVNQIEVVYSNASASGVSFGVTKTKTGNYTVDASATPASGEGVAIIDVSALTGDYYFAVSMSGASGATVTISEIRLNGGSSVGGGTSGGGSVIIPGGSISTEVIEQAVKNYLDENPVEGLVPTVQDYGAKGDGATDDTTAFQAALAENRVVFVPGGTYVLSDTLIIEANCCLELSQDTVLQFTQTNSNGIVMQGSATLRANNAIISVPYGFTDKVVTMDTDLETDRIIRPYRKEGSNQFKRQRFVYDVNIIKQTSDGFCRSVDGKCSGTALDMHTESYANDHRWMWGITGGGIRIAGAFSYGIRALNVDSPVGSAGHYEDDAWNHDLRIEAVIEACEIGVALENCNCAHLSVTVQPNSAMNGVKYAKHGVYLKDSKAIDLTRSRVWDWDENRTLWTDGGQYQHLAMIGNCSGLLLDDYLYYWKSADIRNLIYTDTPSNLEKMTILQEPITRWFKTIEGKPYYYNGVENIPLMGRSEIQEYFVTDRVANFTDVLATAKDTDGAIYNGIGYKKRARVVMNSGAVVEDTNSAYYVATGFIPCEAGDVIYVSGANFASMEGSTGIVYFDANFNRIWSATCAVLMPNGSNYSTYYQRGENTADGVKIITSANLKEKGTVAFVRFTFYMNDFSDNAAISVNNEIKWEQAGFLTDGIKVKGENILGNLALTSPNGTRFVLTVSDSGTLSAIETN